MDEIEQHPLKPFLPERTCLLMLGSFPPSRRRWCMDFFYPNFSNDMWRVFGLAFYGDKERFVDHADKVFRRGDIIRLLSQKGIALYDTACAVRRTRNTASDKDLEIVRRTDLDSLLRRVPMCRAVATTGQKATEVFASHFGINQPKLGESVGFAIDGRKLKLYRMPSTSRAYPLKVESKAVYYADMFRAEGLLGGDAGRTPH